MVDESEKQISPADRASGGPEISASENYTVLAGARVPDFDLGKIRAYAVRDERGAKENLVARICPPEAMPRLQNVGQVRNLTEASLLRPLDYSTVTWPGIDGSSTALIFARPMHGTLMSADDTTINPMHPDEITRCLLGPAVLTLGYMSQRSVTHRAIRPDNIYWDGLMKTSVQLGDCLSTGPAMMQPVLFESIESGMTPPVGRGPGTIADDFYALGVTTLILSLGRVTLQGLSPEEIVREKLRHGSFAALMEGERPPSACVSFCAVCCQMTRITAGGWSSWNNGSVVGNGPQSRRFEPVLCRGPSGLTGRITPTTGCWRTRSAAT